MPDYDAQGDRFTPSDPYALAEGERLTPSDPQTRPSGAAWAAERHGKPSRGTAVARVFGSLLFAGVCAAGAWHASDRMLGDEARQGTADAWSKVRRCMLGTSLPPGTRPSVRLRAIELGLRGRNTDGDWPLRCESYTGELARALHQDTPLHPTGAAGRAARLFDAEATPASRAADLDALWSTLSDANLPAPNVDASVPLAPEAEAPLLARADLVPLGAFEDISRIRVDIDPLGGKRLRLMLPEPRPVLCRLSDGAAEARLRSATCKTAGAVDPRGDVALIPSEPGGVDVLLAHDDRGRPSFVDAVSGQRVLRPGRSVPNGAVDAMAYENGTLRVVVTHAKKKKKHIHHDGYRYAELRPGRAPRWRRLKVPSRAHTLLRHDALLWWRSSRSGGRATHDELFAQGFHRTKPRLLKASRVGVLPAGSALVDTCASDDVRVALLATQQPTPRYTLVFEREERVLAPVPVGSIAGPVQLSCGGESAALLRAKDDGVERWSCVASGCTHAESEAVPGIGKPGSVVASLEGRILAVRSTGGALRMRVGSLDLLHTAPERVLFDDPAHGGFMPRALRLVSAGSVGLLLLQGDDRRVYALRVDDAGSVTPIKVDRPE